MGLSLMPELWKYIYKLIEVAIYVAVLLASTPLVCLVTNHEGNMRILGTQFRIHRRLSVLGSCHVAHLVTQVV